MLLHHLAFRTRDCARLAAFYHGALGLDLYESPAQATSPKAAGRVWLRSGAVVIMIEEATPEEPLPDPLGMDLVAFAVTQQERARLRASLVARGVALEGETDFTTYVRDPDGRRVGFSHYAFSAT